MPNGKTPEDTGEHLMALYGHVEGLKKDVGHLHKDIEKLNDKVEGIEKKTDRLLYWIIGGAFTTILTLTGLFNLFLN
jgi:hypothetical protein